jgi:hypothetical protein
MVFWQQRSRKDNRLHTWYRDTSDRHHSVKGPAPNQNGIELTEVRGEIEFRVRGYPIVCTVWSRDITI